MLQQRLSQIGRSGYTSSVDKFSRSVDGRARIEVLASPCSDRVEILERESQRVHDAVTRITRWIRAMLLHDFANRFRFLAFLVFLESFNVGRRRRRRRAGDVFQDKGAAKDRRGAIGIRRHHQNAALAEQSPAILIVQRDSPKALPAYVRNVVME